jgi:hypothetical protein
MRVRVLAFLLLAGCWYPRDSRAWTKVPTPPDAARALGIVADVFGMPNLRSLGLQFFAPMCTENGVKGYLTQKNNCVQAAATSYTPYVNVCWYPGVKWSTSGLARGVWEQYEASLHGFPDVYGKSPWWVDGTAPRKIAEAVAALAAAGL